LLLDFANQWFAQKDIVISDKSDTLWTYETLINPRIDSLNLN